MFNLDLPHLEDKEWLAQRDIQWRLCLNSVLSGPDYNKRALSIYKDYFYSGDMEPVLSLKCRTSFTNLIDMYPAENLNQLQAFISKLIPWMLENKHKNLWPFKEHEIDSSHGLKAIARTGYLYGEKLTMQLFRWVYGESFSESVTIEPYTGYKATIEHKPAEAFLTLTHIYTAYFQSLKRKKMSILTFPHLVIIKVLRL